MKKREFVLAPKLPLWRRWTEHTARKGTLDRLTKAGNALAEVAAIWGDVDNHAVALAENLIEDIRAAHTDLQQEWAERSTS